MISWRANLTGRRVCSAVFSGSALDDRRRIWAPGVEITLHVSWDDQKGGEQAVFIFAYLNPLGHGEHDVAFEPLVSPTLHATGGLVGSATASPGAPAMHVIAPPREYEPLSQTVQDALACEAAKVPASHEAQVTDPATEKDPDAHGDGRDVVVAHAWPAGHSEQPSEPVRLA